MIEARVDKGEFYYVPGYPTLPVTFRPGVYILKYLGS